ncbi:MAG: helix-turn-helix domain-containing protein [Burkholderiaceae bacterium]
MYTTPFGHLLRQHREQIRHTQKNLASLIGVSESYLCRIEKGVCTPTSSILLDSLAAALRLSPKEKTQLVVAAQESQKNIHLPSNLSLKGYSVSHRFFTAVAQLGEDELIQIEQICNKHILEEDMPMI